MPELERWVLHRLAELDARGARRLRRLRLPGGVPGSSSSSARSTSRRSTSTSARTRSTATRRRARGGGRRARCSTALPPARHLARADAALHHGGGLARALPRRGQLGAPRRLPRRRRRPGSTPRSRRSWEAIRRARRVVTGALEVERREKRIGASLEAAPVVHVADPDLLGGAALGRLRRHLHHLRPDLDRRPGPRRRLRARRRPGRRGGARGSPTARSAPGAGRSCPTSGRTRTPASAPAATRR